MRAVLDWLADFTDLREDVKELTAALTDSGSKVEFYEQEAAGIEGVISVQIGRIVPHPNADKLRICFCRTAPGAEADLQVVTAATNVQEGDIVPLAQDGACLAGGLKIKKGKLRGEVSNGMFCSVEELGYSRAEFPEAPEDGVYIFPVATPLGEDACALLGLDGCAIEFEITSNRPDCFSMEGLGRELAVTYRRPFRAVEPTVLAHSERSTEESVTVENQDPGRCSAYYARIVDEVRIGPSPEWMQKRLRVAGLRSINNIVDITNYVLLELGQPMHAFDLDYIKGGRILIRRAREGEELRTLDGQERQLSAEDLVIANPESAMALAGIMGAEESEIRPETTSVCFESACFAPEPLRRTAARLGLRTESSSRFEKGLDNNNALRALNRACELVEQLGCGRVRQTWVQAPAQLRQAREIRWSPASIARFLGVDPVLDFMLDIFGRLGCTWEKETQNAEPEAERSLWAPTWRPDLEQEADLAEEVARFYGYNNIPASLLEGKAMCRGGLSLEQSLEQRLRQVCLAHGFYQAVTYSFESPAVDEQLGLATDDSRRQRILIRHAAEENRAMRSSMCPSFLRLARNNDRRWNRQVALFEMATVFHPDAEHFCHEEKVLAALYYNKDEDKRSGEGYFRLKGLAEDLLHQLGIEGFNWERLDSQPYFNPYRAARARRGRDCLFEIGYIHPEVQRAFGIPEATVYMEVPLAKLFALAKLRRKARALPVHPPVTRDLSFTVDRNCLSSELEALMQKAGRPLLERVELFDIYEGKQVAEGQKSLTYTLSFRSAERTLTDQEVQGVLDAILERLKEKGAQLRG